MVIPELKSGDEAAWNGLFDKYRAGLLSKTRYMLGTSSLKEKQNAEDLVQETLLKAWKQHESFRGETTSQFAKWILTILRNTYLDACRGAPKELQASTWFGITDQNTSPSAEMISLEEEADLHACLAEIELEYQEVVVLRHFEGLKFGEIAERLGIKLDVAAGRYRRGIRQLSGLVSKRVGDRAISIGSGERTVTYKRNNELKGN